MGGGGHGGHRLGGAAPALKLTPLQCSYAIASTLFAYAELNGLRATHLIDEAAGRGVSPFDGAQGLGSPMSDDGWAAWVLATYG